MNMDVPLTPAADDHTQAPVSADAVATPRPPTQLSRQQILDATAACLDEVGYDATTIRTIARKLNCAVGSIYRYFEDKRQLLSAVTQQRFSDLVEQAREGASVMRTAGRYVAIAAEDESAYRLMFFLATVSGDDREDNVIAGADRRSGHMPTVVVKLIDQWARQLGDVALARRLWALVHGSVTIGQAPEALEREIHQCLGDAVEPADAATPTPRPATVRSTEPVAAQGQPNADDVCLL